MWACQEPISFGGDHLYALARLVTATAMVVESSTGKRWTEDPATNSEIRSRIVKVLDDLDASPRKPVRPVPLSEAAGSVMDIVVALGIGRAPASKQIVNDAISAIDCNRKTPK